MSTLYYYYQKTGGEESWQPIQASQTKEVERIRPTFVTVLALDTLLDSAPSRDVLEKIKYQGPMYFDLDSASIADSIKGAQELAEKLLSLDLTEEDFDIFLSGKKGFHLTIPQEVFIAKPLPVVKLPAVYKEVAFALIVETLDMAVYTARRGRMFRTCFNVRENGNFKVPVTLAELQSMTPETYSSLCKSPRQVKRGTPSFRFKLALEYDRASAKVPKVTVRKPKAYSPEVINQQWSIVKNAFDGLNLSEDLGFNKIGIQLALYAREAGWDKQTFLDKAEGLIANHVSDGARYETEYKRREELARMFAYVEDNSGYEYSLQGIKAMLKKAAGTASSTAEEARVVHNSGVESIGNRYWFKKSEEEVVPITNFVFDGIKFIKDRSNGTTIAVVAHLAGISEVKVSLIPGNFTSSSALQNVLAPYGAAFTGNDMQARGVYQIMITAVEQEPNVFVTDKEGLNLVTIAHGAPEEILGREFLTWSSSDGVIVPDWVTDSGVQLNFQGFPEPGGVIRTDISRARSISDFLRTNPKGIENCLTSLFKSHPPEVVGKALGWAVACNFKPLFHKAYDKFPLLHVYGAAGSGKSELVLSLLRMFYLDEDPKWLTPSGTPFAFQTLVFGSGSIPIILDEYKPHLGSKDSVEKYRALFRDAYNSKPISRGGGSRGKDNFNSLNTTTLSAPVGFISEAVETEPAIMERSVIVGIRKAAPRAMAEGLRNFRRYGALGEAMPVIGRYIAGSVLNEWTTARLKAEFEVMHEWALKKYMLQPEDELALREGRLTEAAYIQKAATRSRPVYNATVSLFGIVRLRELLRSIDAENFEAVYGEHFKEMCKGIFMGMDVVAKTTTPEYIRVIQNLSDMTKLTNGENYTLIEGLEYELQSQDDMAVLVLHVRAAYNKYRAYMRTLGANPLYPGDAAFEIALTETPQYLGKGTGTRRREGETLVFDLEDLIRSGVPSFKGDLKASQK